jgi:hypothetical protein
MYASSSSSSSRTMRFRMTARQSRSGMALLLVLAGVVLITGIAVALLMRVEGGRVMSGAYSKTIEARLLADSAANIVIGQIRDATADGSLAWASQPGAIRTYSQDGDFAKGFKLYSSAVMVEDDENRLVTSDADNLVGWRNRVGEYVDLNESVNGHYPIINPDLEDLNIAGFENLNGSNELRNYQMPVEWLYILKDGTLTAGTYQDGKVVFSGANTPTNNNPIQGRVAFWTDDETAKVNINTASEGLFWDTPRANSAYQHQDGASGYTSPNQSQVYNAGLNPGDNRATDYERGLAYIQPSSREYNRYPGHPAMNCLSVLLKDSASNLNSALAADKLEKIFDFAPILAYGGSRMGSFQVNTVNPADYENSKISLDNYPLYATLDEASMESRPTSAPEERPMQELFKPEEPEPDAFELREFLMTSSSRAPELNMLNRPRIAMWPVSDPALGANRRTAYDNLIEHCGTIRNRENESLKWPFVFMRREAYSQTEDMQIESNQDLYEYLQDLASQRIPGFGDSFASKYSNSDQILLQMLDYIRCTNLFDSSLEGEAYTTSPGATSYPALEFTHGLDGNKQGIPGHGQVLPLSYKGARGFGRTPTLSEVALHVICTGSGTGTDGSNGRSAAMATNKTLTRNLGPGEKSYQAILLLELFNPMPGPPNLSPGLVAEVENLNTLTLGGQPLFPASTQVSGKWTAIIPRSQTPTMAATKRGFATWYGVGGGANMGFLPFTALALAPKRANMPEEITTLPALKRTINSSDGNPNTAVYSLISEVVILPNTNNAVMNIGGGTITITLRYEDNGGQGGVYQTLEVPIGDLNGIGARYPRLTTNSRGAFDIGNLWSFSRAGASTQPIWQQAWPPGGGNWNHSRTLEPVGRLETVSYACDRPNSFPPRPDLYVNAWLSSTGTPVDSIVSLQIKNGDYRVTAAKAKVETTDWEASQLGGNDRLAHSLYMDTNFQTAPTANNAWNLPANDSRYNITNNAGGGRTSPYYFIDQTISPLLLGSLTKITPDYNPASRQNLPISVTNTFNTSKNPAWWGDWDNGIAALSDGPYLNMPDAGNMYQSGGYAPYFNEPNYVVGANTLFFSPNRLVPSSGMFGSLSTGTPWRTLLFRPVGSTPGAHPGGTVSPKDHLLMDWFWMPVVDPYAISEPFSTAGKINMNYQILPFKHIIRKTGLYSVLKAEKIMAIPSGEGQTYKVGGSTTAYRHSIDIEETLEQFDDRFENNEIFISASEICDLYLVPNGKSIGDMPSYWKDNLLTGDNSKERPYTNIYPRLTTKSNTYRVHYRVQVLKKVTGTPANQFVDPNDPSANGFKDQILSEQRGSYIIERYLEHNDPRFGVSIDPMNESLNKAYKFRVVGAKQFNP